MTRRYITGMLTTIHPIEPVSVQPFSVMTNWRIFQVRGPLGSRSRHLASLTAVSGSGRFYRLEGPPGQDPDAAYVWSMWTQLNRATHLRDMTRALLRLRRLRGLHDLPEGTLPAEPQGPLE